MRPRGLLLVGFVASSIVLAGCTTFVGEQSPTDDPPTSTTTPPTTTPVQPTTAPAELSDSVAKERALRAEEAHLAARLRKASCLDEWGTTATTMNEDATVVDRTGAGVIVDVTHPYWYSTGSTHADLGSTARYRVTANGTTRVSGEDVHPC